MNQQPPPPDRPDPDVESNDVTPAEAPRTDTSAPLWEEPKPSAAETPGAEPGTDTPHSTGHAGWEEPRPEHRENDPHGSDAGYRAGEPRPRHPLEENLTKKSTWLRLVFIVVFAVAWWITELVLTAVVVVQFLWVLFNGEPNERLRALGQSLARYAYQIFRYMTFNSDARPFPFDLDWPSGAPDPTSD